MGPFYFPLIKKTMLLGESLFGKREFFPSPASWHENDSTFQWLATSITLLKFFFLFVYVFVCVFSPLNHSQRLKSSLLLEVEQAADRKES